MSSARNRVTAALAAALVLTVLVVPASAAGKKKVPTHGGRGCSMLSSLVDAPAPLVEPFVPEQFTAREGFYPGHIGLVVNTMACRQVTVNGKSLGPAHVSVFWVSVESPDGTAGDHLFEAWRLTDNPKLSAALARHGVAVPSAEVTLETQPPTPAGTVTTSEVTWDGGSSYSAAGIEPVVNPWSYYTVPYTYTLWQLTEGKLVKMPVFENFEEPSTVTEVDGYFAADPGSDFARMIGGAQPTNHALFLDYEFDVEIVRDVS
jgi:hypothetical protein